MKYMISQEQFDKLNKLFEEQSEFIRGLVDIGPESRELNINIKNKKLI